MKKYIVTVKEVWDRRVKVMANSTEDAVWTVASAGGKNFGKPTYNQTLEPEEWWDVEEVVPKKRAK